MEVQSSQLLNLPEVLEPLVSQVRGLVVVIVLSGIGLGWGLTPLETGSL